MLRAIVLAATLIFADAASAAGSSGVVRARALYTQLRDREQCETSLPAAQDFRGTPDFAALAAESQSLFLREMSGCAWRLDDGASAIALAEEVRVRDASWANYFLLQAGIRFDNDAVTLAAFDAMVESDRETLTVMPWRFAWGAIRAANDVDPSGARALRIHDTLAALPFASSEGGTDDGLRTDHAMLLIAAGQVDRARERVSTVTDPQQILIMRVDRRFHALQQDRRTARRHDVRAAAAADLTRTRARAEAAAANLHGFLEVAQALRVLGRREEALAILDQHISRAQAPGGGGYEDTADSLNWLLNERAYVLYDLDRADEAQEAFGLSIAVGEDGNPSVSQVINFASMLVAQQRPRDALEVVRTTGDASPYGNMWMAAVRACAAAQLGDSALQETSMAFLREHAEDNYAAITRASLCVNDLDAAAALYIARLADPDTRKAALLALQRYQPSPGSSLPNDPILQARLNQVRDRADVQAAVGAVGSIEDVPLRNVYWGDF